MSGRNSRCHVTDNESSGSSIIKKKRGWPERYKCEKSETICFSPDDNDRISSAPSSPDRSSVICRTNIVYFVLSYTICLPVRYLLHNLAKSRTSLSLAC